MDTPKPVLPKIISKTVTFNFRSQTVIELPVHHPISAIRIIVPSMCKNTIMRVESYGASGVEATTDIPVEIFNQFIAFPVDTKDMMYSYASLRIIINDNTPPPGIYDDTPWPVTVYLIGKHA